MNITFTGRSTVGGGVNLIAVAPPIPLDGTTEERAGTSGAQILADGFSTGDGNYWIKSPGSAEAFLVNVDMTNGGWMDVDLDEITEGTFVTGVDNTNLNRVGNVWTYDSASVVNKWFSLAGHVLTVPYANVEVTAKHSLTWGWSGVFITEESLTTQGYIAHQSNSSNNVRNRSYLEGGVNVFTSNAGPGFPTSTVSLTRVTNGNFAEYGIAPSTIQTSHTLISGFDYLYHPGIFLQGRGIGSNTFLDLQSIRVK